MIAACRRLSNYHRKQGNERDVRPPCNQYVHWHISRIDTVMEQIQDDKTDVTAPINSMEQEQATVLNQTTWIDAHEHLLALEDWYIDSATANHQKRTDDFIGEVDAADDLVATVADAVDQPGASLPRDRPTLTRCSLRAVGSPTTSGSSTASSGTSTCRAAKSTLPLTSSPPSRALFTSQALLNLQIGQLRRDDRRVP